VRCAGAAAQRGGQAFQLQCGVARLALFDQRQRLALGRRSGVLVRLVVAQPASSISDNDRAEIRAAGLFMIGSMR
jgi:hypothetical protein